MNSIDSELLLDCVPRILLQLFVAKAQTTVLLVDFENDYVDIGTDLGKFARVLNLLGPREVGDMNQTVDALLNLDEYAEIGKVAHFGSAFGTDRIFLLDVLPWVCGQLLDAERHLALCTVESQNNCLNLVANLQEILCRTQVLAPRHLRNVNQTLYTRCNLDECAVIGHNDNLALNFVTDFEVGIQRLPRVRNELLQAESDTLLVLVEIENNDLQFLVEMYNLLRMIDTTPRKVGDVNETIDTAKVDEHTVRGDVLDRTFENLSLLQLGHDNLLLCLQLGLDKSLVGNDYIAELLIYLDNLEFHRLIDIYIVIADRLYVDLRTRQERFDAEYIDNHTALGAALDITLDDFVVGQSLIDAIPRFELASLLVREQQLADLVLNRFYINFDFVADLQFGIVAELRCRNHAFAFVADIYDYLALVDFGYRTLDRFADCDVGHRFAVLLGNLLFRLVVQIRLALKRIPIEILVCYFNVVLHAGKIFAIQSPVKKLIILFASAPFNARESAKLHIFRELAIFYVLYRIKICIIKHIQDMGSSKQTKKRRKSESSSAHKNINQLSKTYFLIVTMNVSVFSPSQYLILASILTLISRKSIEPPAPLYSSCPC